jgi:sugar phosphate isomerase/epimerase
LGLGGAEARGRVISLEKNLSRPEWERSMAQHVELLASYWTIAGGALPHTDREYSPFDLKDRAEAIARVGFKGMGIWHSDLEHNLKSRSLRDIKKILDDNGLKHLELEFLGDWFRDGEEKRESDIRKKMLMDAAEVLGAHHIKVGDFYKKKTPMPKLIESFAALCREAAERGTRILFELMPFAMIDTLGETLEMIEGAGAKNGGIAWDMWHIAKLRIPYEDVARTLLQCPISVEINDGTFEAPWDLVEDTVNHRRFCGEGEFDVKGFVACLLKAGYTGPWGIEVLSQEIRDNSLEYLTTHAYETTIAQFPV